MMPNSPRPEEFRRFLRGELAEADAKRVAAWIKDEPNSTPVLKSISTEDWFEDDLKAARTVGDTPQDVAAAVDTIDRIVHGAKTLPETSPTDAKPKLNLPGYTVVRELGRGGMGIVYEAIDDNLGRRVAVKVMLPEMVANEQARTRFLREGRAGAAVKSEHVVTIHQVGGAADTPFLVMEYLEGSSLDEWVMRRPRPVDTDELFRIARDILSGLYAAHSKGLIHRDIKPSNLWVDEETGRVKLLDFGLTRGEDLGAKITHSGSIVGTPAYMAPEQFDGREVDARADLFSTGAALYHVVSGKSPFQRSTVMSTIAAMATETPPPLETIAPYLPKELTRFVDRLLEKDPEKRPRDTNAALTELSAIQTKVNPGYVPTKSDPLIAQLPNAQTSRSRRVLLAAAVFALLCLPTGALVWLTMFKERGHSVENHPELTMPIEAKKEETAPALENKPKLRIRTRNEKFAWKGEERKRQLLSIKIGDEEEEMDFVLVKGGKFMMGSPADDPDGYENEKPAHEVVIPKDFYYGKYHVTKDEFEVFVKETGWKTDSEKDGEGGWGFDVGNQELEGRKLKYNWKFTGFDQSNRHPVVNVSWNDASEFCKWLSVRSGRKARLPTEAEAEYCIRGGTKTSYFTGDDIASLEGYANTADRSIKEKINYFNCAKFDDGYAFTAPVGSFLPNPFGLHDATGNVWVWCEDWYDNQAYSAGHVNGAAYLGGERKQKVMRGGAWTYDYKRCRAAMREFHEPDHRHANLGIRVLIEKE